jgi:protein KRI1
VCPQEGEDEELDALMGEEEVGQLAALVGGLSDEGEEEEELEGKAEEHSEGDGEEKKGGGKQGGEGGDKSGFKALRKKLAEEGLLGGDGDGEKEEEGGGGKAAAAAAAESRAELNRLLEEYFKLDHEGVAGGIKTR